MTTPAEQKRAQQKRQRLVQVLVRSFIGVTVFALVGAGIWAVYFSDLLTVEQVEVVGVKILKPAEVEAAAQVPLGQPMATVLIDPIAQRVAALAPVETVTVRRSWPHKIVVEVLERTAVIAVRSEKSVYLVDRTGVRFQVVDEVPFGVIEAKVPDTSDPLMASAASVIHSLPKKIRDQVKWLAADTPDSITLALNGGRKVVWGNDREAALKAQVLESLLKLEAKEYDVSSPAHPSTKG